MALSRRTGQRFQGSIWPGFVDAMTGLLLVMMFVLTIFMVVQFVLRETISGQESELDILSSEVAALAQALGLEERRGQQLEARMGALTETLNNRTSELQRQAALIANLTRERDDQAAALEDAQIRITSFEAQVATLLSQRDDALGTIATLESEQDRLLSETEQLLAEHGRLMSEQDALNLALAQSRSEIDAQSEAARLAAARREALEALVADLRAENADANAQADALTAELNETMQALSEEEAARLAEAAAAEALRNRLENADAELTAMTLSLEAQRQQAEDTLTLLAAARAAQKELDARLLVALGEVDTLKSDTAADVKALKDQLSDMMAARLAAEEEAATQQSLAEQRAALLAAANQTLAQEEAASAESQRQTELLNQQVAALRNQLGELQSLLDDARAREVAANVQLESLGAELNTALARVAAEERKRRLLEEAERIRLEEERKRLEAERNQLADQTQDLQKYRSEFFGRLRDVLGNQDGVRIEGDRFVFSSEVLFPPASATLSGEGQQEIAKIATILQSVADDIPPEINWVIRVDGHTDNQPLSGFGEFADNWELSQARALSVVKFMQDDLGFPPGRMAATGFGEWQPVAVGDTEASRAQNRRIELKLTER